MKQTVAPRLLTALQACQYLSISKPILYKLIEAGDIKQIKIGVKSRRYDIKNLDEFIDCR